MKYMLKSLPLSIALASASLSTFADSSVVVEAEDFNATGGAYAGFGTYAVGINHNQSGDWGDYSVDLPQDGTYKVSVFAGTTVSGTNAKITIAGQELTGAVSNTGGWDTFSEVVLAEEITLSAGVTSFRLESFGSPNSWEWNADRIVFTPVEVANTAPVAQSDSAPKWALDPSDVVVQVLNNDSDVDGDTLTVVAVEGSVNAQNGSVSFTDSSVIYTPDGEGLEPDSFSYTVSDGEETSTALVGVYYQPQGGPAVANLHAVADSVTTKEGEAVVISPLANDFSRNGSSFSISSAGMPAPAQNGSVSVNGSSVTYTPNAGFVGTDSFAYNITDGSSSDLAIITVDVAPGNSAPVAVDDIVSWLAINPEPVTINVLSNDLDLDGDQLRVIAVGDVVQPTYGTVTFTDTTVTISDRSPGNADSFSYTITDGTKTATALAAVYPFPTRPSEIPQVFVLPDSATTLQGEAVVIDVLANDFDRTGADLTITSVNGAGPARNGTVTTDGDTVTYTPNPGFVGTDTFTYGAGATGGVTVEVLPKVTTIEVEEFDATGGPFSGFGTFTLGEVGAINHVQSGDWGSYTVNVTQAGTYSVRLYAGTTVNGANAKITFNGGQEITAAVPANGNWDQFDEVAFSATVELNAGEQTLVLEAFGSPNTWEWNAERIELELQ